MVVSMVGIAVEVRGLVDYVENWQPRRGTLDHEACTITQTFTLAKIFNVPLLHKLVAA
jgi:hypothetical protein